MVIFGLDFKVLSNQNDNDFEIEPKYHHETVVLLLTAHILSSQDANFFLILLHKVFNPTRMSLHPLVHFAHKLAIICTEKQEEILDTLCY